VATVEIYPNRQKKLAMPFFRKKWNAAFLLCCVALLKRSADVKSFSIQSTARSLSGSTTLSNTVLRAQSGPGGRPSLQELIDDTIESNRKLVSGTCSDKKTLKEF
jgi:hypothetical protein